MSETSRRASDITAHPDAVEMRERFARVVEGPGATVLDGLVVLLGLYAAVSPWAAHLQAGNPDITVNNLVIGLAMAAFGFCLALRPEHMYRLGWIGVPIGAWMIVSPWVVTAGHSPSSAVIWNNVCIGAVAVVLGLATQWVAVSAGRSRR